MNNLKKLLNNKLNLVVTSILLFLLFIFYNIFFTNNSKYYNIEGYTDQINCESDTDNSLSNCSGYTDLKLFPGTCAESYPPNTDKYRRCVDKPPKSIITPAIGASTEVKNTFCTKINKKHSTYRNHMSYYDCPIDNPT